MIYNPNAPGAESGWWCLGYIVQNTSGAVLVGVSVAVMKHHARTRVGEERVNLHAPYSSHSTGNRGLSAACLVINSHNHFCFLFKFPTWLPRALWEGWDHHWLTLINPGMQISTSDQKETNSTRSFLQYQINWEQERTVQDCCSPKRRPCSVHFKCHESMSSLFCWVWKIYKHFNLLLFGSLGIWRWDLP